MNADGIKSSLKAILNYLSIALFIGVCGLSLYEVSLTLFNNRLGSEARNALYPIMNGLFNTAVLLCIFLLFKKFSISYIGFAVLLGFSASYYELTDHLHQWLLHKDSHPLMVFWKKENLLNLQITKVFLASLCYLVFTLSLLYRRNFNKWFFFIIISVIFSTTFIFHRMSAHLLFNQDRAMVSDTFIQLIESKPSAELLENMAVFSFKKTIGTPINSSNIISIDGIGEFPATAWKTIPAIEKFIQTNPDKTYSQLFFNNGNSNGNYLILAKKYENAVYFYVVESQINSLLIRDEVWFFLLCIMAHTTWLFGGIMLWSYHQYRFKKRINKI